MDAGTLPYLTERYPLLVTKLYIPRLDTELLVRPHLMERLKQAADQPLVVISAPAGWGKTTLVAEWVRQAGHPVGWVSLDEGDNDLARFWLHLIAALQQIQPGVGEAALSWFYAREAPPIEVRLEMLINDLALTDEAFLLVLDDYHLIHSQVIHDSLTFLIENLPPNVHLILTSRSDLPFSRARWRTRRRLVELDSQDLRFSPEECAHFLHRGMGLDLTPEQIATLIDRTEGWIAGIQLAALALQGTASLQERTEVDDFIFGLSASSRYIFDYLGEEVLAGQKPEIQKFLLETSVLERMSSDLCRAVTGDRESQRILQRLEQSKLFIIALDEEQRWFRYHHLFRDFLSSQLTRAQPNIVSGLHRRAAQWYAAREMPYDAVPHALAAQDYELAGRIMMQYANPLWQREEFMTLHGWLEALPRELRERHPDLCLFQAWSLFIISGLEKKLDLLVRAEALLDEGALPLGNFSTRELRGILAVIQAAVSVLQQDLYAASEFARSALALLPPERKDWRYAALVGAGRAHYYHNDIEAAVQAFEQAFKEAVALPHAMSRFYSRTFARSWLARLYFVQGSLQRAKEIYQEALRQATGQAGKPIPIGTWALTGLGELYYQWNELESAETYFNDSLALSTQITPFTSPPYLPLARLAYAHGDVRSAQAYLAQAARLAETARLPYYSEQVELCRVWLTLQPGDLTTLEHWVQDQGLDLAQPTPPREATYVIAARILLAQQDYPAALALIEKLLAMAEEGRRGGVVIELLILKSLALQAQDKLDSALAALHRALALASQEGFVRIFVDEGEAMLRLLRLFVARFGATDYSAKLLSAFMRKEEALEILNERELGILRLLATGMSNKEIGKALFITVGTVKWHTSHIYAKLGVKNRGEAVAKSRELHLNSNSTS
jgi:LuxR family maltose regulon positive regulatory protein